MQVRETYELSKWYLTQVQPKKLDQQIADCINGIKNLGQTATNVKGSINPNLSNLRSNLYKALQAIDSSTLTSNQRKCLTQLGISFIASEDVMENFDRLFDLLAYDVTHTLSTFELYNQQLKVANQSFTQISSHIPKIIPAEDLDPIAVTEGKVLTRITFQNQASIGNLVEFNSWAKSWNYIARGISIAIDESPEDFEVVNADKGSLIVDILASAGAITVIATALKSLVDLASSVIDCRIKLKELDSFKNVVSDETYQKFESEALEKLELEENSLVAKVVQKLKDDGLVKAEHADNELSKAIREIYKFNSSGGGIFCLASNDEHFDNESVAELNHTYAQLQEKPELKLIEDKKSES